MANLDTINLRSIETALVIVNPIDNSELVLRGTNLSGAHIEVINSLDLPYFFTTRKVLFENNKPQRIFGPQDNNNG